MSKEETKLPWYYKIEVPLWLVLIIVGYLLYYIFYSGEIDPSLIHQRR